MIEWRDHEAFAYFPEAEWQNNLTLPLDAALAGYHSNQHLVTQLQFGGIIARPSDAGEVIIFRESAESERSAASRFLDLQGKIISATGKEMDSWAAKFSEYRSLDGGQAHWVEIPADKLQLATFWNAQRPELDNSEGDPVWRFEWHGKSSVWTIEAAIFERQFITPNGEKATLSAWGHGLIRVSAQNEGKVEKEDLAAGAKIQFPELFVPEWADYSTSKVGC